MKKSFLIIALLTLFTFTACNENAVEEPEPAQPTTDNSPNDAQVNNRDTTRLAALNKAQTNLLSAYVDGLQLPQQSGCLDTELLGELTSYFEEIPQDPSEENLVFSLEAECPGTFYYLHQPTENFSFGLVTFMEGETYANTSCENAIKGELLMEDAPYCYLTLVN